VGKAEELAKIRNQILNCRKCSLFKTRTNPVFGEGNSWARIIFIGEAPGFNEDKIGRPFCGQAGKVLDELLKSAEIKREEIFITNILKCRPPGNRDPRPEEILACSPYLESQINIIRPEIICTLGNYSTKFIFERFGLEDQIQGISKIHGKIFEVKDPFQTIKIIPFYHPAVATYNPNMRAVLKEDFKVLKKLLICKNCKNEDHSS